MYDCFTSTFQLLTQPSIGLYMVNKPPALDIVHYQLRAIATTANRHLSRERSSAIGAIRERQVKSSQVG